MKNRKGFTLVELLGVIVILAAIAAITIPTVTGIIKNNKEKAYNRQVDMMIAAAKSWAINNSNQLTEKDLYINNKFLYEEGFLDNNNLIDPRDNSSMANFCVKISYSSSYQQYDYNVEDGDNCIYREIILNGADPVLSEGMIPVTITDDGTVTKADTYSVWYNYEKKRWANIVLVTEASRSSYTSADANTIIKKDDILAYFVWVPRYKYKLFNVTGAKNTTPREIKIIFENKDTTKSNGSLNEEWLTHPAFTFGTEELNGIWVGKFDTVNTDDLPMILPNMHPLINQNISTQFQISQKFNNMETYGINDDAHMAKNSEWGAAIYLFQSKYGLNEEMETNDSYNSYYNNGYITGCGDRIVNPSDHTTCENLFGSNERAYLQSTTGNITGIFDMSGGPDKNVMGKYTTGLGSSGFTSTTLPESKYYETYDINQNVLGEALFETQGWYYNQYIDQYVSSSSVWFSRSGDRKLFGYDCSSGSASSSTFRVILVN